MEVKKVKKTQKNDPQKIFEKCAKKKCHIFRFSIEPPKMDFQNFIFGIFKICYHKWFGCLKTNKC